MDEGALVYARLSRHQAIRPDCMTQRVYIHVVQSPGWHFSIALAKFHLNFALYAVLCSTHVRSGVLHGE